MSHPTEFNPLAAETVECPYPFYQAMRDEQPVYEVPGAGFFIVSRYEDILYVLNHEEIFSSMVPPGMQARPDDEVIEIMKTGYLPVNTLLTNDPPSHTRYRSLVNKAFSARRVAQLEPSIRLIAKELIDAFVNHGKCELVSQFAVGLPLSVIADALGVTRADLPRFKKWSDDSVAPLGGMITHERQLECARSVVEFQHYFAERLEERRSSPRDDILSDLINARLDKTEPLNTAEMLSILQQLLVAGNETTTNLIGSTMLLLCRNPDQMDAVTKDRALISSLVEEALRVESPVQGLFRVAKLHTELGAVEIPAGARMVLMYASGNRDEAHFADAPRFDVCRANARTHLAFGQGVHFCIGAALARLEVKVGFEALLARIRNIRLAKDRNDFTHTPSFILRGLRQLHIEFDPA